MCASLSEMARTRRQSAQHAGALGAVHRRPARRSAAAARGSDRPRAAKTIAWCGHRLGRSIELARPPSAIGGNMSSSNCAGGRSVRTSPVWPAAASRRAGSRRAAPRRGCTPRRRAGRPRRPGSQIGSPAPTSGSESNSSSSRPSLRWSFMVAPWSGGPGAIRCGTANSPGVRPRGRMDDSRRQRIATPGLPGVVVLIAWRT